MNFLVWLSSTLHRLRSRRPPSHIPSELIKPVDSLSREAKRTGCPYTWAKNLGKEGPLVYGFPRVPVKTGSWIPTNPQDIKAIFANTKDFVVSGTSKYTDLIGNNSKFIPFESDGQEHARHRFFLEQILKRAKTPVFEKEIRKKASELVSKAANKRQCDFVKDCASRFPVQVLLHLLEFPEEQVDQIVAWQEDILANPNVFRMRRGAKGTYSYIESQIKRLPENSGIRSLAQEPVEGEVLSENELLNLINALFVAGLHTVTSALYNQIRFLGENPVIQNELRANPKLISGAVEEMLRTFSTASTARYVRNRTSISGVELQPGDHIVLNTAFLNFDENIFSSPEKTDVTRDALRNYSFARGAHMCVGADLARLELTVFLEEWLKIIPEFKLKKRVQRSLNPHSDLGIHSVVTELPLTW